MITEVGKDIIRLLLYSDIFKYPLKSSEIYSRLRRNGIGINIFEKELHKLVEEHRVNEVEGYFLLENNIDFVKSRKEANANASLMLLRAYKKAKLISNFPFVRAVFLSGSISKGYADKKSDIDYFIITKPGRLWIARTLLIMYKKIFLLNSYKYFCLNYFVDQDHLEIDDRNIFTATELTTLIPVCNIEEYNRLCDSNPWVINYYPHFHRKSAEDLMKRSVKFKNFIESVLNRKFGDFIDNYFMKQTIKFINPKLDKLIKKGIKPGIVFKKHVCKYHRNSFRDSILEAYQNKVYEFENRYKLSLT